MIVIYFYFERENYKDLKFDRNNSSHFKITAQAFTNCVHSYDHACNVTCKQHYAYTKIHAWYEFFCVKII